MGRAPCCDKANVKRGPWSPEEDAKLKSYIEQHGTGGNWIALPQKIGLKRCGKSCRLRWLNYLRPNIKHGGFSEEEDNIICSLYISIGSRWSIIAAQLPGRTDNDIKNYWNTKLKKKLLGKQRKEKQTRQQKQEIKRETEDYYPVSTGIMSQATQYWPQALPTVMLAPAPAPADPNQSYSHFKDQESLRNLLIKLGGKFSDNEQTFQYPLDHASFAQDQVVYDNASMTMLASTSMSPMESANMSYDVQGLEYFQMDLNELMYGNENHQLPQQFDELGNFYGIDGSSGSGSSTSIESSSWGEMNPLANYPQIVSGFEGGQQNMPQVSNIEESSYFRPQ